MTATSKKTKQIAIVLDEALVRRAWAYAAETGMKKQELVALALTELLDRAGYHPPILKGEAEPRIRTRRRPGR